MLGGRTDTHQPPPQTAHRVVGRFRTLRVLGHVLTEVFYDYATHTKVNGLYYLRRGITTGPLRILWTLIPISILLFGGYLVILLARDYNDVPTLMIIDRPLPVQNVHFPAITFCHPQTVIDYKARQFVANLTVLPPNVTADAVLDALPALGLFVENPWGATPDAAELRLIDRTLAANNLTVPLAMRAVGLRCRDFIRVCAWAKVEFDCFQSGGAHLSFRSTVSYLGMCCSFNYHPTNASYQPYKAPTFGTRGGLSIIGDTHPQVVDGRSGGLFSTGMMMLLHHAYDYPAEGNQLNLVEIGAVTSVAVYPTMTHSSSEVLDLPMASRRCVLDYEIGTTVYRQPSCAVGCTRSFIYKRCGCHPFFMPRAGAGTAASADGMGDYGDGAGDEGAVRNCTAADVACFAKNFLDIKRAKCGYCLPACIDIDYEAHAFSNMYNLRSNDFNVQPIYQKINVTEMQFTTHVYLANQVVRVQKQVIVMSFINLLSNFGGVFNLCLGVSILSMVEVIIYVFIKFPQQLWRAIKINQGHFGH